jgi:TatA/E family protein of Tat protein translocase
MGSIGFGEILVVLLIAFLLFGEKLPQVAKKVGSTYRDIREKFDKTRKEIQNEIDSVVEDDEDKHNKIDETMEGEDESKKI